MKKVISYSLYGSDQKYLIGALRNVEQASKFYPGWIPRFYVGESVHKEMVNRLLDFGAEVIHVDGRENSAAMFWRFKSFFDPCVSVVIIRDADSRLSLRESEAVKFWLDTDKGFHIMRDHPAHYCPILGGLWGARTDRVIHLKDLFERSRPLGFYGEDQNFLEQHVYPIAKNDSMIHDSFFSFERSAISFPIKRSGYEFVGEVFDEHDMPRINDRNILRIAETSFFQRLRLRYVSFYRGFNRL